MFLDVRFLHQFSWKKPHIADLAPAKVYQGADRQAHLPTRAARNLSATLRVVYEIQSRLQREDQLPNNQDSTTPPSSPDKNPGTTDVRRQYHRNSKIRANDLASRSLVLAAACPACSEGEFDEVCRPS